DPGNPLTHILHRQFEQAATAPETHVRLHRFVAAVRARYSQIVHNPWFRRVITALFCLQAAGVVVTVLYSVAVAAGAAAGSAQAHRLAQHDRHLLEGGVSRLELGLAVPGASEPRVVDEDGVWPHADDRHRVLSQRVVDPFAVVAEVAGECRPAIRVADPGHHG